MKTPSPRIRNLFAGLRTSHFHPGLLFLAVLFASWVSSGETIYNNSTNDLRVRFDPGTVEVGDQIVLAGSARYLTNFSFEYWGTTQVPGPIVVFAGNVEACVRFYLNNGVEFNGYASPGTKFYESEWFPIQPTGRNVLQFSAGSDLDPEGLLLPASEFTWSVQFRGMNQGDAAGIDVYSPATIGQNYPDYWEWQAAGWQLMTNTSTPVNFAAVFQASAVPAGTLPALQISNIANDKVVVSWPHWASDFQLERSSQVTGPSWDAVTDPIYISGDNFVLTNNVVPGSTSFYRLQKAP